MKIKVLIITVVCAVAVAFFLFFVRFESQDVVNHTDDKEVPGPEEKMPIEIPEQSEVGKQDVEASHVMREYNIVDSADISPTVEEIPTAIYRDETLTSYRHTHSPANLPWLELRFRKPGPSGEERPYLLQGINFKPWEEGEGFVRRRTQQELTPGILMGVNYDDSLNGSKAVRMQITDDLEMDQFQGLYMGYDYYVRFLAFNEDSQYEQVGSCLLRVPENVPPGKVAVMEVDVTQQFDPHPPDERKSLIFRMKEDLPGDAEVFLSDPGRRRRTIRVGSDGTGKAKVHSLGGELIVVVPRTPIKHRAVPAEPEMLYYKQTVTSNEVVFPDDADIVRDSEKYVNFSLEVPYEHMDDATSHRYILLVLFVQKESQFPLTGRLATVPEVDRKPERIQMSFLPGEYYVGYITDKVEYDDMEKIIGRIKIRPEDEGRTLRMQPLGK